MEPVTLKSDSKGSAFGGGPGGNATGRVSGQRPEHFSFAPGNEDGQIWGKIIGRIGRVVVATPVAGRADGQIPAEQLPLAAIRAAASEPAFQSRPERLLSAIGTGSWTEFGRLAKRSRAIRHNGRLRDGDRKCGCTVTVAQCVPP